MKTKAQTAVEFDAEMTGEEVAAIQPLEPHQLNGDDDRMIPVFLGGRSQTVSEKGLVKIRADFLSIF